MWEFLLPGSVVDGLVSCEMLWRPFELQFKALPRQKNQIVVVSWCKKRLGWFEF